MPRIAQDSHPPIAIEFEPASNRNMLQYSTLPIRVRVRQLAPGPALDYRVVIRTNLNQGRRIRRQIIDLVEKNQGYSTDFFDIPAVYDPESGAHFADILLNDIGFFEFKVRAESTRRDQPWVCWADGPNVGVSVTPLDYARENSVYCAFVRQYVDEKHRPSLDDPQLQAQIAELEQRGAYVIPPGGDFQGFLQALPFIIRELGMKIIHLLPINPVPTSYGRMGMYGSPYATTDYFGIDHTYATFSQYQTIEDQFIDVTSTIHGYGARVFLDMVINHTGWASSLLAIHRNWFRTTKDRKLLSPGAWGVVWEDLVELDYRHRDLWLYMANVFLTWCRRGVDGFRLDAGYMVPLEVWRYIIAKVREEFPRTVFLLEGLGGPWETTENLLTHGQMNWAYSELFQNYSREQITDYLTYAQKVSSQKGVMVHYAETHDNDRLAKKGKDYTRMRLHLSAFTSFAGAWGFTNGVEWLAAERINVHRNTALNWDATDNLVQEIAQANRVLAENPAFWELDNIETVDVGDEQVFAFTRADSTGRNVIAAVINLDTEQARQVSWDLSGPAGELIGVSDEGAFVYDLLDNKLRQDEALRSPLSFDLQPGECQLLQLLPSPQRTKPVVPALLKTDPDRISLIYQILLSRFEPHEIGVLDQETLIPQVTDFRRFIVVVNTCSLRELVRGNLTALLEKVTEEQLQRHSAVWTFREASKEFIISGDQWLMAHTFVPCTAYLRSESGTRSMESIACADGPGHMVFFPPQAENQRSVLTFNWKIHRDNMIQRQWQDHFYPILSVPSGRRALRPRKLYPLTLSKDELAPQSNTVLLTNGRGALCQCPVQPGVVLSKYDTLLAVAGDLDHPTQRLALIKNIRENVQIDEKFFDLDQSFVVSFTRYPYPTWEFLYDDGEYRVSLQRILVMGDQDNQLVVCYRLMEANAPVGLTAQVFLDHRNPHDNIQLDQTPHLAQQWTEACTPTDDDRGVRFTPEEGLTLSMIAPNGEFISQPHWTRNIAYPLDEQRGMDPRGDAFSPGVFHLDLKGGQTEYLLASTAPLPQRKTPINSILAGQQRHIKAVCNHLKPVAVRKDPVARMLALALDQFIIDTPLGPQLAAGYPWLPVGARDGLISVPGLVAAGRDETAWNMLRLAARTEREGRLANWLSGAKSGLAPVDAGLHLLAAIEYYVQQTDGEDLWNDTLSDGRTLRDVAVSIYENAVSHVVGESVDPLRPALDGETGMLYCPANMTWMNTDHPRATPRPGYPVEVQALWLAALETITRICPPRAERAAELAGRLRQNFNRLFWDERRGYAYDLLQAAEPVGADIAPRDPALRFNQLALVSAGLLKQEQIQAMVTLLSRRLLIPGALRSLAEEPLTAPLEIRDDKGALLVDPQMPYRPHCQGDETQRRLAYHNGTAWSWAYPSFVEARAAAFDYSPEGVRQALAFFEPVWTQLTEGGIGTINEMMDGNFPHVPRGCVAHAPAVAETLRVYVRLRHQIAS